MGKDKGTTVVNQTSTPAATPEEAQLNQLEIERQKRLFEPTMGLQQTGIDIANRLLSGSTNLPGFYGGIAQGIPSLSMTDTGDINAQDYMITPGVSDYLAGKAVRNIMPKFQSAGILDSGVAADIAARTAGDIYATTEQRNLDTALGIAQANEARKLGLQEFNINTELSRQGYNLSNLFNLLNLGVGGQAQVQQPLLQSAGILSQRLAGLRPVTTQGTTTAKTANPFLQSFQTSLGQSMGQSLGSGTWGKWGK